MRQAVERIRQIHRTLSDVLRELDEVMELLKRVESQFSEDDQEIQELRKALNDLQLDRSNRPRPRFPSSRSTGNPVRREPRREIPAPQPTSPPASDS